MSRPLRALVRRGARRLGFDLVRRSGDTPAQPWPAIPADLDDVTAATARVVAPYTLTTPERVAALCAAVRYLVAARVPGDFVECGVWRGGSALAMLLTLRDLGVDDRDLWLYDTFTHMPPPGPEDVDLHGERALDQHARLAAGAPLDPAYEWLPVEEVHRLLVDTGYPAERIHLVPGLVEETVPAQAPERVALLRLDTDYYGSTRHELEHLYPRIPAGGVLVVDDYGHWQGSRQAVDEYLARLERPLLLHRIDYSGRIAVVPGGPGREEGR